MRMKPISHRAAALMAVCAPLLFLAPLASQAGDGHDHGEAPAANAGPASPRFTASSELFELVGVVSGQQITLYLDHADSNAPVKEAQLEIEIGGSKLKPTQHAEGAFKLTLAEALKPGLTAVTATVTTPADADLLAGEIDVHEEAQWEAAHAHGWKEYAGWALAGLAALAALVFAGRRLRRTGAAA